MAAANTTTVTNNFVEILLGASDGADWYLDQDLPGNPGGIYVKSITFYPSNANDVIIISNSSGGASLTGAIVWQYKATAVTGDHRITFNPPSRMRPAIDVSTCTLGTSLTAYLLFELA